MKKCLFLTSLFLVVSHSLAEADNYRYRVYFDGKPDSEPVALSERALQRRERLSVESDEADYSVSETYLQQLRAAGLTILTRSRWLNTAVVALGEGAMIDESLWSRLSFVKNVELLSMPESKTRALLRATKRVAEQTLQLATKEDCTTPLKEVNAYESLYKSGFRGEGMLIAVFDGGYLRLDECDFLNSKVVFSHDLYYPQDDSHLYVGDNHGIKCMSVMACPEEEGVCGTASEAQFCLFNTEDDDHETAIEEDMWVAAAEMADSLGVDVISSSLGYYEFDNNLLDHTHNEFAKNIALVSQGAKIASQKGILVVNSAGNEGSNPWEKILFPADTEEVLTIGAYTPDLVPASFTGHGFLSPYVKPDVSARGTYCYAITPTNRGFGPTNKSSGTSFSTPLIAGLCASLWSAVPELTPAELRQVVQASASDYLSPNIQTGYGLPDFAIALRAAQEMKGHTGIEQITIEAASQKPAASDRNARYYNLMGQPLDAPPSKGTYICNGKVISVF